MKKESLESRIIDSFGEEWSKFKFLEDSDKFDLATQASSYLAPVRKFLDLKSEKIVIADFGAGSGRWSEFLLPFASTLMVIEPSAGAFETLKNRFKDRESVVLMNEKIETCDVKGNSLDLAVCLGVLHHIPNILEALSSIFTKLKPGGLLLCYLYYNFENRSKWYVALWRLSNLLRLLISNLPHKIKFLLCDVIALFIYLPLARFAKVMELCHARVRSIPLSHYRHLPFMVMRNDSLDRFGTLLEQRFSREEILQLLATVGFNVSTVQFSDGEPFWTFSVAKE